MLFFDDLGPPKKKLALKVPPPAPETGWRAPAEFPNLSAATVISFDLERHERDFEHGPGWARGKATTVGFSIACKDRLGNRGCWYFPIRHEIEPRCNLDPVRAMDWLRSILETSTPKVGANLLYDIGSLTDDAIDVKGDLYDIQFAEALIDTDAEVALDKLAYKYLGEHKQSTALYDWCATAYGGKSGPKQRENIWRAPPKLVGPYGEADAWLPIDIYEKQLPLLYREQQYELFRMECELIPLLIKMRQRGITIDLEAAEKLYAELTIDIGLLYDRLAREYMSIDSVNSGKNLAKLFDHLGLQYPLTEDGNPSFRKDFLKNHDHPVTDLINEIRECEKIHGTFIKGYILNKHVNGKIHCSFHPLKGEEGGAKTGRFSSSDPNLQNIPVRTKLGKKMRGMFVKDYGHICIEKNDMSQQEYRDLAHFAVGPGSDELRLDYQNNPKTDYHERVQLMIKEKANKLIERRPIKNINFGLLYGMNEKKLNRMNDFGQAEGKEIFTAYHSSNPYVRATMRAAAEEMQKEGFITTILNRRIRFNYFEPIDRDFNADRPMPLPLEMALQRYGSRIKRAGEHKAINYRLQGSNADQLKNGMRNCYAAGVFDYCGIPRLQVHDELVFSVEDDNATTREAFAEMRNILETCIPHMRVPVRVDFKRGPNWGACE